MLDIKFVRENPEIVKENIKKKFKDAKLPLVDKAIELDEKKRAAISEASDLRANRNKISREIGALMSQGKKDEAMKMRELVSQQAARLAELEKLEAEYEAELKEVMMKIPNIIDESVPLGASDEENVEVEQFGEQTKVDFESTKRPQARSQARAFTTLWEILQGFTVQFSPTLVIL